MSDIIQKLRDTYCKDKDKVYDLLPELFKQYDKGLIQVLPCDPGNTVYTIQRNHGNHGGFRIVPHTPEGFEIRKRNDGKWELSPPGEFWAEGLAEFGGIDDRCYYSRTEAEKAKKELEAKALEKIKEITEVPVANQDGDESGYMYCSECPMGYCDGEPASDKCKQYLLDWLNSPKDTEF